MNLHLLRLSAKNLYALTFLFLTFFIVQNASAQNCAGNLFNNAGFEQGFGNQTIGDGWEGYGGTSFSTDARSGQRAVALAVSDYRRIWQFIPAQPGQEYTASGYLKGNSSGTIGIKFLTADYQPDNLLTSRALNGNYTLVELTRTAPANAAWVEVSIYSNANTVVLADDFCLTVGGSTPNCSLATNVNVTACDDGNTTDPSDDRYNFVVDVTPTNGGTGYTAEWFENGARRVFNRNYPVGIGQSFNLISTGTLTLTLTDNADPNCQTTVAVVPPAPCSGGTGGNGGDLKLTATGAPANLAAWQFGSSTFTITNEGTQAVSGAQVSFDLAASAKLKGGDEYDASQGTLQDFWTQTPVWAVGNLAPGQSETIELNIFTLAGGSLPIYGQVSAASGNDPDSSPNNGTPPTPNEDDEAVFTFNGGNTGAQPDLTFGTLFINNAPSAGEVLNYNFNLINAGTATVSGNYNIKAYISTDNVLSADDIQDGIVPTGNTPVGTINTVPGASTLPANLPQGSYWLILKVDADDQITESNEGNNLVSAQFTTQGGNNLPDLAIQNVEPRAQEVFIGQSVSTLFDGVNFGEPVPFSSFPIIYALYMSTDRTLDANDIKILDLGLGQGPGLQFGGQVPPNLAPGNYYLIVETDFPNNIQESNEGNNWAASNQTVSAVPVGSSCSFVKNHETPGNSVPSITSEYLLTEDVSGYKIETVVQTSFNPRVIVTRKHELGLNGGLISVTEEPIPPGLPPFVDLEVTADKKLVMIFQDGSDLPAGTRVSVDVGNADPTEIYAPTSAYRTVNGGYAFGLAVIDTDLAPILKNIVIKTDNVGQNTQLFELQNPDFFYGFSPSLEGSDGSLFFELTTSGNFSLYGIPASGTTAWRFRVAADTPSTRWNYTELSKDGKYIYTAKTDNLQAFISKINTSTGVSESIDLSDLKAPVPGGNFRYTFAHGIKPTDDGGLLASVGFSEPGGPNSGEIIVKYDAAGNLLWSNDFNTPTYSIEVTPLGETSDGGALFVGRNTKGTNDTSDDDAFFIKTAANGALAPFCDTGSSNGTDLELSFSTLSDPSPAQWGFFNTTLTVTNTGTENASGVSVKFNKADEVVYSGGDEFTSSQGDFQYWGNEIWTVGNLAVGQSATLTVNYFRLSANPFVAFAEVESMTESDRDSAPGNGICCSTREDDEAVLSIGSGSANSINNRNSLQGNIGEREVFAIISAAPNPTTGYFNLEVYANESQVSEITIVDILGKPVFQKEVDLNEGHNSIPIDLENRGTGMMMVKMTPFHPYLRQIRVMKVRD